MAEKPLDLRIQKTHKALIQAFLKLLEEKQFEDITVNEICELAEVRRATFYKHFGDKDEFFSFMVREMIAKHREEYQHASSEHEKVQDYYIYVIERTLQFLENNDSLMLSLAKSKKLHTMSNMIREELTWEVTTQFREDEKNGVTLPIHPASLMASIFTGALMSGCIWWIEHPGTVSRAALIEELSVMLLKM